MTEWAWVGLGTAVAVVLIATAAILVRVLVGPIVGPMFRYELVRLSRRGALPKLRAFLVALLLIGLFVTYLREFPVDQRANFLFGGGNAELSIDQTAQFGNNFFIAFLSVQMGVVILITPVVAGSAISEEKERGTFEYLTASLLSNREIVLGKLCARMLYVVGVVLAGVPVLSLTALFGGIDLRVLLAGYFVTGITIVSLAAFCLHLSVGRDGLRDVLVWAYGVTAVLTVLGMCCGSCLPGIGGASPASVILYMFVETFRPGATNPSEWIFWLNIGAFALIHLPLACLFTILAITNVRKPPPVRKRRPPRRPMRYVGKARNWNDPKPKIAKPVEPKPEVEKPKIIYVEDSRWDDDREYVPLPRARRGFWVPKLGENNPFLWKERYFPGGKNTSEATLFKGCGIGVLAAAVFGFGLAIFIVVTKAADSREWIGPAVNPIYRTFACASVMVLGLGLAARSAAAIVRERQQQTLTGLLTMPVPRSEILAAKWIAAVFWSRFGLLSLAIGTVLTLIVGGVHPLGAAIGAVQMIGFLLFANSLGIWLSVRCQTVTRAMVYLMICLVALWLLPLILSPVLEPITAVVLELFTGLPVDNAETVVAQFSLPVGVWNGLFAWDDVGFKTDRSEFWAGTGTGLAAGLGYCLMAGLLWLDALRKFQREGKN